MLMGVGVFPRSGYIKQRYACNVGTCPSQTSPSQLGNGYVTPITTFWQRYAQKVQLGNRYAAGRRLTWVSQNPNAYLSPPGAPRPSGYPKPPRNTF